MTGVGQGFAGAIQNNSAGWEARGDGFRHLSLADGFRQQSRCAGQFQQAPVGIRLDTVGDLHVQLWRAETAHQVPSSAKSIVRGIGQEEPLRCLTDIRCGGDIRHNIIRKLGRYCFHIGCGALSLWRVILLSARGCWG